MTAAPLVQAAGRLARRETCSTPERTGAEAGSSRGFGPWRCAIGAALAWSEPNSASRKRMSTDHLDDLRARAQHARQRYQLYKAKAFGQRPTSQARLRELQRECEQAEARLRAAQAEEQRRSGPGQGAKGT